MEKLISFIDRWIYKFLIKNSDKMPVRFIKFIAYYYTDARVRKVYLEKMGCSIGKNTYTNLGFKIAVNKIESNKIIIGNNVSIGPNVTLVADSCANNGEEINKLNYVNNKLTVEGQIIIEDDVWLGANVTILPNVIIGKCSIIGAGSVVVKDVEPYSIYIGIPARKFKDIRNPNM